MKISKAGSNVGIFLKNFEMKREVEGQSLTIAYLLDGTILTILGQKLGFRFEAPNVPISGWLSKTS